MSLATIRDIVCHYHNVPTTINQTGNTDSDSEADEKEAEAEAEAEEGRERATVAAYFSIEKATTDMLVVFECVTTTAMFEHLKLPHTYDQVLLPLLLLLLLLSYY